MHVMSFSNYYVMKVMIKDQLSNYIYMYVTRYIMSRLEHAPPACMIRSFNVHGENGGYTRR